MRGGLGLPKVRQEVTPVFTREELHTMNMALQLAGDGMKAAAKADKRLPSNARDEMQRAQEVLLTCRRKVAGALS